MANFMEENKKGKQEMHQHVEKEEESNASAIIDYKNKNLQNNVKNLFQHLVKEQRKRGLESDSEEEEDDDEREPLKP